MATLTPLCRYYGGEFLNAHLHTYLTGRKKPIHFTRSRPYRKNDNAHVEQKNWTQVRQLLGYERLEDPQIVELLNELYRTAWEPFHNFFRPCVKLLCKERIGTRYRKSYDQPKTPYQRLMECGHLCKEQRQELKAMKERMNPLNLKAAIEEKLQSLFEPETHVA